MKKYGILILFIIIIISISAYFCLLLLQKKNDKGILVFKTRQEIVKHSKVLYCEDDIILRGNNDTALSLFTTPDFDPVLIPESLRAHLEYLQSISFNVGFGTGKVFNDGECSLPDWLSKQKKLKLVELRFFVINDLATIKRLPLKYLLLDNILINNRKQVIGDIKTMHQLKYLIQDDIFTSKEVKEIVKILPNLNCLTIKEYTKMIIEKKIDFNNP